jgi:solute carrier family 25 carnitine/acylcarnitine transporter 20/29
MLSPLLGIAAVNALLFTANNQARRFVNPFGELSLPQIALAGGIAGGVNAVLASPVEMFKVRPLLMGRRGGAQLV